jgi:hypothetical protein
MVVRSDNKTTVPRSVGPVWPAYAIGKVNVTD